MNFSLLSWSTHHTPSALVSKWQNTEVDSCLCSNLISWISVLVTLKIHWWWKRLLLDDSITSLAIILRYLFLRQEGCSLDERRETQSEMEEPNDDWLAACKKYWSRINDYANMQTSLNPEPLQPTSSRSPNAWDSCRSSTRLELVSSPNHDLHSRYTPWMTSDPRSLEGSCTLSNNVFNENGERGIRVNHRFWAKSLDDYEKFFGTVKSGRDRSTVAFFEARRRVVICCGSCIVKPRSLRRVLKCVELDSNTAPKNHLRHDRNQLTGSHCLAGTCYSSCLDARWPLQEFWFSETDLIHCNQS